MVALRMNVSVRLVLAAILAVKVQAHIALWDEAMYGWDDNVNQYEPVLPLERLPLNQWWFHNYIDRPPAPGKIMYLPAGGTYHGQVACNKAWTRCGSDETMTSAEYACDDNKPRSGTGAMHTTDEMGSPSPKDVKGCGLAIAYESDVTKLKPEDFTVVSIAYDCPWKKNVDFHIPADLPACPEGGCHCSWGWVHSKDGGSAQMYHLGYRCDVTGATLSRPLPKPLVSRKCDFPNDVSNCTVGSKQPHYWLQADGSNNFQGEHDPPYYNQEMGFMNGAQTDLFAGAPDEPVPVAVSSSESMRVITSAEVASPTAEALVGNSATSSPAAAVASPSPASNAPSPAITPVTPSSEAIASSISASASAYTEPLAVAPTSSAAATSGKTCRRRRRRSLDAQRHKARAGGVRNRTMAVRHTTAAVV